MVHCSTLRKLNRCIGLSTHNILRTLYTCFNSRKQIKRSEALLINLAISSHNLIRSKLMRFFAFVGAILAISILISFSAGMKTTAGILQFGTVYAFASIAVILIPATVAERFSFKKAYKKELRTEDDILLQATAFSQAALWIYLSLAPSDLVVDIMKAFVPSAAIAFYIVRAYAKLKDNDTWRFYSIYALSIVFGISIGIVFLMTIGKHLENIWFIDGVQVGNYLMSLPLSQAPLAFALLMKDKIRKRYGLP